MLTVSREKQVVAALKLYVTRRTLWIVLLMFFLASLLWWGQNKLETVLQERVMQLASDAGVGLGFRDISMSLFRPAPVLHVTGLSVGVPEQSLALSSADISASVSWSQLLGKNMRLDQVSVRGASVSLAVEQDGTSNWDKLIAIAKLHSASSSPNVPFNQFDVSDAVFSYTNEARSQEGRFSIDGAVYFSDPLADSQIEVTGDLNAYPVRVVAATGPSAKNSQLIAVDRDSSTAVPLFIDASVADTQLLLTAVLDSLVQPTRSNGQIQVKGRNAGELVHNLNLFKTDVSIVDGGLSFDLHQDSLSIKNVSVQLGKSELTAEFSFNQGETPALVSGEFNVGRLDLDELLGVSSGPLSVKTDHQPPERTARSRLFASNPFQPDVWFSDLTGTIDTQFQKVTRGGVSVNDLSIDASFNAGAVDVLVRSDSFTGGMFSARASVKADSDGVVGSRSAKVDFELSQVQMLDLLLLTDTSAATGRGKLSGQGTFWVDGFSPSSLASSLDGGLFFVVEDGELDSMLVEMAGIDLMESINLLIKRNFQQTPIRCGYMDIQADSGKIDIQDFVIDTEDTLFLAKGGVDLNKESISLKFEPHPRDASFFAAPTALEVSGTLAAPAMRPGRSLYSRIAVAGALAALAGPAAIVLPFIEIGRGGKSSNCEALFSQ